MIKKIILSLFLNISDSFRPKSFPLLGLRNSNCHFPLQNHVSIRRENCLTIEKAMSPACRHVFFYLLCSIGLSHYKNEMGTCSFKYLKVKNKIGTNLAFFGVLQNDKKNEPFQNV